MQNPSKLIAKDLETRKGKLFDFSKGVSVGSSHIEKKTLAASAQNSNLLKKNAGPGWFNMESPEVTPEVERDLRMVRLRGYMDPKRFYKKDDFASKKLPDHFQIGTVIAGLGEKSLKRKERYTSITREILGDEQVRKYARRVFEEVGEKGESGGKRSYQRKQNKLASRFNKKKFLPNA